MPPFPSLVVFSVKSHVCNTPSLTHPVLPSFLLFLVPSCLQSPSQSPSSSYLPLVLLSFFVFSSPIVPVSYSVPSFVWVFEVSLSQTFVAPFTFSLFVLLRCSSQHLLFTSRSPGTVWSVPFRSSAPSLGKLWPSFLVPQKPGYGTWLLPSPSIFSSVSRPRVASLILFLFVCIRNFGSPSSIFLRSKILDTEPLLPFLIPSLLPRTMLRLSPHC